LRICDLKEKEVINTCDCKRLGFVEDIEFDMRTGQVQAVVVPGPGKFCGLICPEYEYVIPFKCICQIGDDVMIVKVCDDDVKHKAKMT